MKRTLLGLATALALTAPMPAFAQAGAAAGADAAAVAGSNAGAASLSGSNSNVDIAYGDSVTNVPRPHAGVPNVISSPTNTTAPCMVPWAIGGSAIGIGLTAGGAVEDKECTERENARILHGIGYGVIALEYWRQQNPEIDAAARVVLGQPPIQGPPQ